MLLVSWVFFFNTSVWNPSAVRKSRSYCCVETERGRGAHAHRIATFLFLPGLTAVPLSLCLKGCTLSGRAFLSNACQQNNSSSIPSYNLVYTVVAPARPQEAQTIRPYTAETSCCLPQTQPPPPRPWHTPPRTRARTRTLRGRSPHSHVGEYRPALLLHALPSGGRGQRAGGHPRPANSRPDCAVRQVFGSFSSGKRGRDRLRPWNSRPHPGGGRDFHSAGVGGGDGWLFVVGIG